MCSVMLGRSGAAPRLGGTVKAIARWASTTSGPLPIAGLPREALATMLWETLEIRPKASDAIFSAVHREGLQSWDDLTVVGATKRAALASAFSLDLPEVVTHQASEDGTRKWLLRLQDGTTVETVYIPEEAESTPAHASPSASARKVDRGVLCVSSQVGCSLACSFCHTGTQALKRNLTGAEIVGQLLVAQQALGGLSGSEDPPSPPGGPTPTISNIVFMGQGEPLYNWRSVSAATTIMTDRKGGSIAHKRCTISTSGVAPHMGKVGGVLGVNLALSLHATTDATRSSIMGINRTYPLPVVLNACREYRDAVWGGADATASRAARAAKAALRQQALRGEGTAPPPDPAGRTRGRRILFEYTLLEGVNDTPADAERLVHLTAEFNCHVNVIPFNPWPGAPYACPPDEAVLAFGKTLLEGGVTASIRWPRGRDIMAACGQLTSAVGQEEAAGHAAALSAGMGGLGR